MTDGNARCEFCGKEVVGMVRVLLKDRLDNPEYSYSKRMLSCDKCFKLTVNSCFSADQSDPGDPHEVTP